MIFELSPKSMNEFQKNKNKPHGKNIKNGNVTDFKLQGKLLSQNQTICAKRREINLDLKC